MKIRLDENLSPRIADALMAYLANRSGFEVSHNSYVAQGHTDPSWITSFADSGGDLIISGDFRILQHWPDLVAYLSSGLIAFFPSPAFGDMKGYGRASFILRWWPAIVEKAKTVERGTIWRIPMIWTPDITKFQQLSDPRFKTDEQRQQHGIQPVGKVYQIRPRA